MSKEAKHFTNLMRTEHTLWRVSNGWLLVPEGQSCVLNSDKATECAVFKTLKEFADQYPKRERKRKTKKEPTNAN